MMLEEQARKSHGQEFFSHPGMLSGFPQMVLSSEDVNSGFSKEVSKADLSQTLESNLVLRETQRAPQQMLPDAQGCLPAMREK